MKLLDCGGSDGLDDGGEVFAGCTAVDKRFVEVCGLGAEGETRASVFGGFNGEF